MQADGFREQFTAIADAWALAQGIVDTVREPVLVLDKDLRVIAASRSFYSAFKVSPADPKGRLLYTLGDGQWDIPKLRVLLEKIIPEKGVMEGYEVEHEFPGLGLRTMWLNARQVFYEGGANTTILLGMEDVTERRILEIEKDDLFAAEGHVARGTSAPNCQQPADHCQHDSDESARRAIGRDPLSSARHAQECPVDCGRAETASCLGSDRINPSRALSYTVVREPCGVDDWRHLAHFAESDRRRRQRHVPSGGESRPDRDRTRHERTETRLSRR
jgi:hypothetical protein